ncbi:glycoside hydrolase family 32 protein [Cytophagaceae bacterium DM2B3-1]|uniref:Glycoside hydrolase family 32 protein n=1 Tax=Xanthocytophaga flava TaxID=3048013 RepID=A0ABT7CFR0_9BACT|nr:glycoside hydrolase family 32 protein [Xanthocytophaga flavus]MDJ1492581.1 glycoside hydrolase family 32 protein [Xanthocytophaga flavus]
MYKRLACLFLLIQVVYYSVAQNEPHRPQFHFSPNKHWMNDPNGMVYYKGTYHLFFQHYPDGTTWGPMHWGHATSADLVHWTEQPIALYPDSLGYIFSGSVVVDKDNTSGLGKNGVSPLVAIFTHHNPDLEKQKSDKYQYQSLAYSLDEGKTWKKYENNPVLPNPGITDFRDPKVRWYEPQQKWIMSLATKDRITFYSSPNLKNWTKESEFGQDAGSHGGVWECPDLFPLTANGKTAWVLLVSINPGGPNEGSATQYFIGDFDGKTFKPYSKETKWIDYGTDNYAGVTIANTNERTLFLGWMSNWLYGEKVPTSPWRSAMTVPRELGLTQIKKDWFLTSVPVKELNVLKGESISLKKENIKGGRPLTSKLKNESGLFKLDVSAQNTNDFSIVLANDRGNEVIIGYDKASNVYYIDRTHSGQTNFREGFGKRYTAPRLSADQIISLTVIVDVASVELFADNGLTVMTGIFFPEQPMSQLYIKSAKGIFIENLLYTKLKPSVKQPVKN